MKLYKRTSNFRINCEKLKFGIPFPPPGVNTGDEGYRFYSDIRYSLGRTWPLPTIKSSAIIFSKHPILSNLHYTFFHLYRLPVTFQRRPFADFVHHFCLHNWETRPYKRTTVTVNNDERGGAPSTDACPSGPPYWIYKTAAEYRSLRSPIKSLKARKY